MGKRISQLTQLTAANIAQTDLIPIVDVSAGATKYATVKDLVGIPDNNWTAAGETWSYSSFSSTTRKGVITVPSDATTKYSVGMWVRFSQTTGGTKWGVITAVTTTTLTVNMFSNQTLANETITTPMFSALNQPYGAPKIPYKSTDANGWDWYDYGIRRVYKRQLAQSGNIGGGAGVSSAVSLPSDNANTSNLTFMSSQLGGYIGRIFAGIDTGNVALPVTSVGLYLWNVSGSTINYVGVGYYEATLEAL